MTNKQWIESLTEQHKKAIIAKGDWCSYISKNYGCVDECSQCVSKWLEAEHKE